MKTVAFVAYPGVLASSIHLPAEILTAASQLARVLGLRDGLQLHIRTLDDRPVMSSCGLPVAPDGRLAELAAADLIILPTIWRNPRPVIKAAGALLPKLRQWHGDGSRLCGVGTATCLLAEAGLLDHRPATTHWSYFDRFARHYPLVKLQRHHLITQAGTIYCAGSINSVADLMVHLVELMWSGEVARGVEQQFSPEIRRSYRTHGFFQGEINRHPDELVTELQRWLQDHYSDRIDLNAQAARLGISRRTLDRRFHVAAELTPGQYLQRLRLDAARELLAQSNLSVSEIATTVGFGDVSYFSALFRRQMGASPGQYRLAVRGKLFAP